MFRQVWIRQRRAHAFAVVLALLIVGCVNTLTVVRKSMKVARMVCNPAAEIVGVHVSDGALSATIRTPVVVSGATVHLFGRAFDVPEVAARWESAVLDERNLRFLAADGRCKVASAALEFFDASM